MSPLPTPLSAAGRGAEINAAGGDASRNLGWRALPLRIVQFGNPVVFLGNPGRYAVLARRHKLSWTSVLLLESGAVIGT
jgi:hypothetical protein